MEDKIEVERGVTSQNEIFKEVLNHIRLKTDDQLKQSLLAFSEAYFDRGDFSEDIWSNAFLMRSYLIDKTFSWLGIKLDAQILECGSAGDISAAAVRPEAQVTSLDIDPDIFYNVPYNYLPPAYLDRIGKKKKLEYYGPKDILGRKKKKLKLVQEAIPNWKMEVGDAKEIKHADNTFDVALVQGTPDMLGFIGEMARVVKPGSFIVSIVHEEVRDGEYESAYDTRKYNSYPDYRFVSNEKLEVLGLERVQIPDDMKGYENLCEWGNNKSAGYVFEVFKKKIQPRTTS
jgi:SAM-dependent methyltransferase